MSDVATVTIITKNGPVVINQSDYNPAVHKLEGEVVDERKEAKAFLDSYAIPYAPNLSTVKLLELVVETKAKLNG